MKAYNLKSVVRRGSALTAAFVIAGASLLPVASTYADALNPLTDRSLTLSSSAPGWDYLDGSGNTKYAQPNSGANGQKTGNTFSFKVSSTEVVEAMTFQYCTQPAGTCTAPGNNVTTGSGPYTRGNDSVENKTSDLNIAFATPVEVDNTGDAFFTSVAGPTGGVVNTIPNSDNSEGNFLVMYRDTDETTWSQLEGWTLVASPNEDGQLVGDTPNVTGKNNFITLTNTTGLDLNAGAEVKIMFFATETNYITNPGEGAFFVRIDTFNDSATQDDTTLIDGGVTVANVMNLGISIQTKVLETMDFSVGTVDPYTLESLPDDNGAGTPGGADETSQLAIASGGERLVHGGCDPIYNSMDPDDDTQAANTLLLGDPSNDYSLNTAHTYSTHSYFRLSSNASAGATVYYSGVTLSNTVDDQIAPIGATKATPTPGTEQFGLALDNGGTPNYEVSYATEREAGKVYQSGADNAAAGLVDLVNEVPGATGIHDSVQTDWTALGISASAKLPQLRVNADGTVLLPQDNYNAGTGVVNGGPSGYGSINTQFAFDDTSNLIPVAIASEESRVVDCASAKVRYIANIAATTPAGIYTTKINYIAAPQY